MALKPLCLLLASSGAAALQVGVGPARRAVSRATDAAMKAALDESSEPLPFVTLETGDSSAKIYLYASQPPCQSARAIERLDEGARALLVRTRCNEVPLHAQSVTRPSPAPSPQVWRLRHLVRQGWKGLPHGAPRRQDGRVEAHLGWHPALLPPVWSGRDPATRLRTQPAMGSGLAC